MSLLVYGAYAVAQIVASVATRPGSAARHIVSAVLAVAFLAWLWWPRSNPLKETV